MFKSSAKKMIEIKLVDVSIMFYCNKFHFFKSNSSGVISIKQQAYMNCKFQPLS
jgi:hypothetical protein